ncbi:Glutamine amidotransferase [Ignavibacterium album JCM 16511]|uniref:Glutamine amidotransferase n=1 Tax=Ignavibacterium album (strain DSM 19864 / JCM 16511 / NBRC 101810 / Mat9-16) TaxID=945713 RepID=I0AIY4_IGNAJ|nr:class II glutamine amidotransferase [Ignavibacterium album]AFH48941.1 Glutamine amidotransferase [Ignavibacterium album JCM 16511]
MCELLGLNFNREVVSDFSFSGFSKRGKDNPDGWGLAYYNGDKAEVIKEASDASQSILADSVRSNEFIRSKIFIAHVRYATAGTKSFKNTHPFKKELNGKQYIFAHNGTIKNFHKFKLEKFKPEGQTDSEHIFCYLLNRISEKGINNWDENNFIWLHNILSDLNEEGKLNCLFSDGEHLFCYRDKNTSVGLNYVLRKAPFDDNISLNDEDFDMSILLRKFPAEKGYIIATEPLTNEHWQEFEWGSLKVFRSGEMIFESY